MSTADHYHDNTISTITKQSGIPYSLHPYEEPFYAYIPAIDYQGFIHE